MRTELKVTATTRLLAKNKGLSDLVLCADSLKVIETGNSGSDDCSEINA